MWLEILQKQQNSDYLVKLTILIKATEAADTSELNWASLSCLAVFYIENEMYLKADKIARKFIKEFPDNCQGYHLHILIEAMREHYDEVFAYMDILPEKFKNHPQFLGYSSLVL